MKKILLLFVIATVTLSSFAFTQDDAILYRGAGSWFCDYSTLGGFGEGTVDTSLAGFGMVTATPLVGDINGDGVVDMVVAQVVGGGYQWVAAHSTIDGSGKGLMSKVTTSAVNPFGTVTGNDGNMLADINGDGIQDIVTINAGFNWFVSLSTAAGIASGATQGPAQFGLSATDDPICGDFDGDGYDDQGIFRHPGGSIYWKGSAGGVIGAGAVGPIGQIGGGAGTDLTDSLIICNLNGDAYADAVMVRQTGAGLIQWWGLINDGTGSLNFVNPGTSLSSFGLDGTDFPMMGDINGDGMDDIVINRGGGVWYTTYTTAGGVLGVNGAGDSSLAFGLAGDTPLLGQMKLVPEPATLGLLAILGLAFLRRK